MDFEIRPVTDEEIPAFARAVHWGFGAHAQPDQVEDVRNFVERDRTLVAVDGTDIVGTGSNLSLELTVPGDEVVAAAGVTFVAVLPTHRRRGILTAVMARLLDDARSRGEPVAALHASEAMIYGRFGFGVASWSTSIRVDRARGAFRCPAGASGRIRLVDAEAARAVLPAVYDRARRHSPGEVSRSPGWWARVLRDPEQRRGGAGALFAAVHEGPEGPDGFAAYRIKESEPGGNELRVHEVVGLSPEVEAVLWRYILDVDLVGTVVAADVALDDCPLRWLLADFRALSMEAVNDRLWVRVLDVPAVLAARRYPVEGAIVVDVAGEGRWRLDAGPDGADVRATTAEPDVSLDVADLGTVWMGGASAGELARAGRVVEHTRDAVRRADALFAVDRPPFTATMF